jgi:hypothetical protein
MTTEYTYLVAEDRSEASDGATAYFSVSSGVTVLQPVMAVFVDVLASGWGRTGVVLKYKKRYIDDQMRVNIQPPQNEIEL